MVSIERLEASEFTMISFVGRLYATCVARFTDVLSHRRQISEALRFHDQSSLSDAPSDASPLFKDLPQHDRVIAAGIGCAVEQGDPTAAPQLVQQAQRRGTPHELGAVLQRERLPAAGVVSIPPTQRIAWCRILEPEVDGQLLLAQASRLEAIDEHAHAHRRGRAARTRASSPQGNACRVAGHVARRGGRQVA